MKWKCVEDFCENGCVLPENRDSDLFTAPTLCPWRCTSVTYEELEEPSPGEWQPKNGEVVEVSHDGAKYEEAIFIGPRGRLFIGCNDFGDYIPYNFCRPIPTIEETGRDADTAQERLAEINAIFTGLFTELSAMLSKVKEA